MIKARRMNHDHLFNQIPPSTVQTRSLPDLCPELENTKKQFATLQITCEEVENQNNVTKNENTNRVLHSSVPSSPVKLKFGMTTDAINKNKTHDTENGKSSTNIFSTQDKFKEFTDISLSNSSDEEKNPQQEVNLRRDSIVDSVFKWLAFSCSVFSLKILKYLVFIVSFSKINFFVLFS